MRRRDQWIEWIRAGEREGDTAAYALSLLQDQLRKAPSSLRFRGLGHQDFAGFAENREATYLVRLFAEFENGLREAWNRAFGESSHPKTMDLLNAVASRCRIPNDRLTEAHRARVYRNSVVHDVSELAAPIMLAEVR